MAGRVVIFGWAESVHVQRWAIGLTARGYDLRVISLGGTPITGVETFCLPRRSRWSYYTQASQAVRLAREFRPDLVHVHYAGGFGCWGLRCHLAPLVVSVWGADVVDLPHNPLQRLLIRKVLRQADRITATSHFLSKVTTDLQRRVADEIAVIPFGVELPPQVEPAPAGPFKLCFIKAHRRKYGPDVLLRAVALVRSEMADIRLTLAGEGELTSELRRLAADLDIHRQVDFVGFVPNDEIYSLLERHHIMVMPSVMDSESFGVAVLEASACARPVIASRVGGVPEVLKDGETGLMVPPGDVAALAEAILKLARDPGVCARMGQSGRELVREKYQWDQSLDMMASLYREIING